jgi:signal transduction histidine kinase/ligand-binding sensor domain-containing protein
MISHSCSRRTEGFVLTLLLLIASAGNALAQRLPFFNLGIEGGLIQSQAMALAQDSKGYLWIGTLGGLTRYDGRTLTTYTVRDGLPDNAIMDLLALPDGMLYIGTGRGLSRYDGKRFQHFAFAPPGEGAPPVPAVQLQQGADGAVWCLAAGKRYRVWKNSISEAPDAGAGMTTAYLLRDSRGRLLSVTAGSGYVKAIGTQGRQDSMLLPLTPKGNAPFIARFYVDRRGRTWALSNIGPLLEGPGGFHPPAMPFPDKKWPPVYAMTEARDGSLWAATGHGALRITDSAVQHFGQDDGLSDNIFFDALTDAEGNIWLASDGQGVFRFSGAPFAALDEGAGLPSAQIMAVTGDGHGNLYLGTYDAGLFVKNAAGIKSLPLMADATPSITALAFGPDGRLWVGTRGWGLFEQQGGRFIRHTIQEPGILSDWVGCLYLDAQRRLWAGFTKGAAVWNGKGFDPVKMPAAAVQDFLQIGEDSVLMATNNNLMVASGGAGSRFRTGTVADSSTAQSLAKRGSEIWIGTGDNGVICYNRNTRRAFVINRDDGLHSEFVYNLVVDRRGDVWAGTGRGIHRICREADGSFHVDYFGKDQGVMGLESNHNAVWTAPDGSIWFGTTNGAVQYRPTDAATRPNPTALLLNSVALFGQPLNDTTLFAAREPWTGVPLGMRLPYKQNNLTFSFGAISLGGQGKLLYRYVIDGLDTRWSDWAPTNTVTFSALPPGKFLLRVQVSDDGKRALRTLSYPFEIITPFHRTWAFRLLVLAACILLGVGIQHAVSLQRQRRQLMMARLRREEQAKVRERTAEDFHDEVGNTLTRINVLTNVLKSKVGTAVPDAARLIGQIQDNTGRLYQGTRDILWSLKPSNDNLYEILHRIRDFGTELFSDTPVKFSFTGTDERWRGYRLPLDMSRNLTMIFKEALNNALKYSGATEVTLEAILDASDKLTLKLRDNGKGFDAETVQRGHGLANIRSRAGRLGGIVDMHSEPGSGTAITLSFRAPRDIAAEQGL